MRPNRIAFTARALSALSCALALGLLAGPVQAEVADAACPADLPAGTHCLTGQDEAGAYVWLAVPPGWDQGTLVVHAHGGPDLGPPSSRRAEEDLQRWSIWLRAGYAYAASSYAKGGVAVRAAAVDTERARRLFVAHVGVPRRTVLHGQSWGASVAAKAAETFGLHAGEPHPYDAVLLTSGVLGGGTQSYNFRVDLRVVYQAVCGNHPGPDEPAYPLWQGLPPGSALTRADLARRVDACTGVQHPRDQRTAEQQQRLDTLLQVVRIREGALISHLQWATWHFQDIVFNRLGGRNPFTTASVRYTGSADDAALNTRVARYRADPEAVADLAADTDLGGRIPVPVLTLHAIDDPTAFVELESRFRDTMSIGGNGTRLVQTFTADHEHSYLSDAQYVTAMQAVLVWLDRGDKPTPAGMAAACGKVDAVFDPAKGCRFRPDYTPGPLDSRTPAR